jgi:hypothetical protein
MATEQQQEQQQPANPSRVATKVVNPDLSAEIAATIDRDPGDRVRVTHIGGDSYRCNWWAPGNTASFDNPSMYGLTVTTHVVRKSQFLTVVKVNDRLDIRKHSRTGAASGT